MNYSKIAPPDTFIGQYLKYMSVLETPVAYDFWSAMWALSVGVGRGVYVARPHAPVYLNWYIILTAESGITRKSTAVEHASHFVEVAGYDVITGKTVPEELMRTLHEDTKATGEAVAHIAVPELVTIMGRESYMKTMPGLLTDLHECPESRRSPGSGSGGEIRLSKVYVTFFSASTPTWLVSAINPAVLEGGFGSRVLIIAGHKAKASIAWPDEARSTCPFIEYGKAIRAAKKIEMIEMSKGGLKTFKNWYKHRPLHADAFRSSFESREDGHVLRVAALLAVNDGTLQIQDRHVKIGYKIIADVKAGAAQLFGVDYSPGARFADGIDKIRQVMLDCGMDGITHTKLYIKCRWKLDRDEFSLLVRLMHECGMLKIFDSGKKGRFYRATKAMEGSGLTSEVLARLNLHQD